MGSLTALRGLPLVKGNCKYHVDYSMSFLPICWIDVSLIPVICMLVYEFVLFWGNVSALECQSFALGLYSLYLDVFNE